MPLFRQLCGAVALALVMTTAAGPAIAGPAVTTSGTAATAVAADSPTASVSVAGLTLTNSFVSSLGWVKPGQSYPSRILLTNTTRSAVSGATVDVTAPRGSTITSARSAVGTATSTASQAQWSVPELPAGATVQLVLEHRAADVASEPTVVWRDLSTAARLSVGDLANAVQSHGPKVIPPGGAYDTARYGDRPFPVVPVAYNDRDYQAQHSGGDLDRVVNDPTFEGSTYSLYQEMSLGQLYPHGTVPSSGVASRGWEYEDGFPFTRLDPEKSSTCTGGLSYADTPSDEQGTVYTERISNGVYQLPGNTAYYGADGGGSGLIGALAGVSALMQIDSGCGPTGKLVYDTVAISDPEIDFSDYDTDKDGVVDFFMVVFAGCGGNGASQLSVGACEYPGAPYDNVWPHSSSLEYYYSDPETGLTGYTTDDQLKDLEGNPLYYTSADRTEKTTTATEWPVFVRVGPYNVNPETAIDRASVISHEYGHSLGLPDFYSLGNRETYGTWSLMAADHSQSIDIFGRQELGWVVPEVLRAGQSEDVAGWKDSKEDIDTIHWQTPSGEPYTLTEGVDGRVQNSQAYVAKLPGRVLLDPAAFETGDGASATHTWWSNSGNDFGCVIDGKGHNIDLMVPGLSELPTGSSVALSMKSRFDIEWDYDYGFVLTSTDGGRNWASNASTRAVPTTTESSNPNQNGCQAALGNGITGSSASYADANTPPVDRLAGNYPSSTFVADSFDVSELAGAEMPVLRFSYATDPGLARPGWFIDDVTVTATLPDGTTRELMVTDFESDGGPDDGRIFNGGCADEGLGTCTAGWTYVEAGSAASYDHAYYLELRDRSGFDLDGNGQSDRGPVDWAAGLSLVYTDEAHGYGNTGADNQPAQTPLDSQPEPGSNAPDLSDAAWTAAAGDNRFTDADGAHVENYELAGGAPWVFDANCLTFDVTRTTGEAEGPQGSDGDLAADVSFAMGPECAAFDYAYGDAGGTTENTAPTANIVASATTVKVGTKVTFDGTASRDAETPDELQYVWNFGDSTTGHKDAYGPTTAHKFGAPGTYTVTLTVIDPQGLSDTRQVAVRVVTGGK